MAKTIKAEDLGVAISEQLELYQKDVIEKVNTAGAKAMRKLVKRTRETAPIQTGEFGSAITSKAVSRPSGDKLFIWGARAPHHRLTHLLVHGHATVNGGRVPGDPFLKNALDAVLPEYEEDVKEALRE